MLIKKIRDIDGEKIESESVITLFLFYQTEFRKENHISDENFEVLIQIKNSKLYRHKNSVSFKHSKMFWDFGRFSSWFSVFVAFKTPITI